MHKLLVFQVASCTQVGKAWRVANTLPLKGLMKEQTWKGMLPRQHVSPSHLYKHEQTWLSPIKNIKKAELLRGNMLR